MGFTQTLAIRTADKQGLLDLLAAWDHDQAGVAPGYLGNRLLADLDEADRYLIVVDFSSRAEAELNNERAETQEWAQRLQALIEGDPDYGNYEDVPGG